MSERRSALLLFAARVAGGLIGLLAFVALLAGLDALLWLLLPWYREQRS